MDNLNYWPYTDIHELNLDWILEKVKALDAKLNDDIDTYVQEYIDEHFEDWTVNANYDADTQTIVYTNGKGAQQTLGDVIRFAIDKVFVNIKDAVARTAAGTAQTTADTNTAAIAAMDTAYQAADTALSNRINTKTARLDLGQITANSEKEAILAAFNSVTEYTEPFTCHFSYGGEYVGIGYKYLGDQFGMMLCFKYSTFTLFLLNIINGTPHLHSFTGTDIPF